MKKIISIIVTGIMAISMMTSITIEADSTTDQYVQEVFKIVNEERAANGLPELSLDSDLNYLAQKRAEEITSVWGHTRPDGTSCFTIFNEYNITRGAVGENIAAGNSTPLGVMDTWMNSDGHRANILDTDFTDIGIGFVKTSSGYGYYWVQIFANNLDTSNSTVPKQILGDINGDGSVGTADIILLAKYLVQSSTDYSVTLENADMNDDGLVNTSDLVFMAKSIIA